MHKSLLENKSDDTADFGDSDEEILHEIGEDDRQLYPDSDWNKREEAAFPANKFCTRKNWRRRPAIVPGFGESAVILI